MKAVLWISSILHIIGAFFAAASVKTDLSNQVAMMLIMLALFAGAVVDGFVAYAIKPRTEVRYVGRRWNSRN